jgi:hypothetical protein
MGAVVLQGLLRSKLVVRSGDTQTFADIFRSHLRVVYCNNDVDEAARLSSGSKAEELTFPEEG